MADNVFDMLIVPQDVMHTCAKRARELRIRQNITQKELAERVGVAEGTIKRFEHTGEIQFRTLLGIALFRYIKQGRLRLLALLLILIGGSFMLVEFFEHITFGTPMFVWSLYCVCGFGALGLFLFVATLIPPLHAHLRKTFFF